MIQTTNDKQVKPSRGSYKALLLVGAAFLSAFLVSMFLIRLVRVTGASMEPTFREGAFVLADRLAYRQDGPGFGDVIVFKKPDVDRGFLIKRVAGLPGDKVELRDGLLYRNDVLTDDAYGGEDFGPVMVPEACCFVLGDNRGASHDSRVWEAPFVPLNAVLGQVRYQVFPSWKKAE